MIIRETLSSLGLDGLIGTPFEESVKIEELKAGDTVVEDSRGESYASFVYRGSIQITTFSIEGREFYTYRKEGELTGVAESFSHRVERNIHNDSHYGKEILAREDTILVYLPLGRILEMDLPHRDRVLERLLLLTTGEGIRDKKYLTGRIFYSDMEFLLKALEKLHTVEALTARELARALNMNLRNLQRLLTKLEEDGIVDRRGGYVSIRDIDEFHRYMRENIK